MLKYTASHSLNPIMSSNVITHNDMPLVLLLIIAMAFTIVVIYTVHTWDTTDKTLPVNTGDSCLSSSVNLYVKEKYQQQLSPIRRSRSRETVDSMV